MGDGSDAGEGQGAKVDLPVARFVTRFARKPLLVANPFLSLQLVALCL